mgnify:CR=1 FL=1
MDKQIEEVFESDLWEILYNNGCSEKVGVKIAEEIIGAIKNALRNGDLIIPPKDKGEKYCWLMTNIMLLPKDEQRNLTMALVERDGLKSMVERAKLEGKIEAFKEAYEMRLVSPADMLRARRKLQKELKELSNESD